jgi:hypothetical protein
MHAVEVAPAKIFGRRRRSDLAVEGVPRLDLDFLARHNLGNRRDGLVPAVVPLIRFLGETFVVIDRDALHSDLPGAAGSRLCARPIGGKCGSQDRNRPPHPAVSPRKF